MSLDFSSITGSVNFLLAGAAYTFELTAITAVLGLALGTLLALARLSTVKWLSYIAKLYIDLMRAVPLVLVLFWFFLLMPEVLKIAFGLEHPVMIGANLTAIITFVLLRRPTSLKLCVPAFNRLAADSSLPLPASVLRMARLCAT